MGQMNTVINLLKTVSFGNRYFEIAVTLINGMLTSIDILYGLRNKEIEELEEVDKLLIRSILNAPVSFCIESFYLELGLTLIRIILKSIRIAYYHYLVNLNKNEMLHKFFEAQYKYPGKVVEDLEDFGIPQDFTNMKSKSKFAFTRLLIIKTKEYTLDQLLAMKSKHSTMDNLMYTASSK